MTVSSTLSRNDYTISGTAAYPFTFRVFAASDLVLTVRSAAGIETRLVLDVDFTVSGVGSKNGGTVTLTNPAAYAGYALAVRRVLSTTQETAFRNQGAFFAESHEVALDRLAMVDQQQAESIGRAIKASETDPPGDLTLPAKAQRVNSLLGFDGDGKPVVVSMALAPERPVQVETQVATAGQTGFVLNNISYTPGIASLHVYVDGLRAGPADYTEASRTTVVFNKPLSAGAEVLFEAGTTANKQAETQAEAVMYTPPSGPVTNVAAALDKAGFYTPAGIGAGMMPLAAKLGEAVSITDFMSAAEIADAQSGAPVLDHTAAFSKMFASVSGVLNETYFILPHRAYNAREIILRDIQRMTLIGHNCFIYGIATTPTDALLRLHNVSRCRFIGIKLSSDADGAAVTSPNYGCALRITSNSTSDVAPWRGAWPSNQNWFMDGEITKFKRGVVSGNYIGEAAQQREAQDSNYFVNWYFRSVMQPFYGNALNSGVMFSNTDFTPQQFSASATWWDDTQSFCLRNDEGRVVLNGCILQKAIATGWTLYGKDFAINATQWEASALSYLTGDVMIDNTHRGYCLGLEVALFQVAPGTTGRLVITNTELRRIGSNGVPDPRNPYFVDALDAPNYRVEIDHAKLSEWYFDPTTGTSTTRQFMRGGMLKIRNTEIKNTSGFASFYFDGVGNLINTADTEGDSMSTTADLTAKGGWTASGLTGGNFQRITTDLPAGKTAAFAVESVGTAGTVAIPTASAFRIKGGRDYVLSWLMKHLTGTGNILIGMSWYDFAGAQISAPTVWSATAATMDANGWDDWARAYAPCKAPSGAVTARITITTSNTAIRAAFTDWTLL